MTTGNFSKQDGSNLSKDSKSNEKCPKFNWSQHASAHEGFSCQNKFLSSNSLFSLPTQKPSSEGSTPGARAMACSIVSPQRLQNPQIKKAWQTLSSLQVTCRSYLKPGRTSPGVQSTGADNLSSRTLDSSLDTRKKTTVWSSSDMSGKSSDNTKHEELRRHRSFIDSNPMVGESVNHRSTSVPERRMYTAEADRDANIGLSNGREESMLYNSPAPVSNASSTNCTMDTNQQNGFGGNFADDLDDDDILKNLDVDQIVMEHFQSTCTPQSALPKHHPFTPVISRDSCTSPDETCLPPELSAKCNHGFKVALCPEAATHLQEKKDILIAISNELLDNVNDLNPSQIEKLRQDRLQLNKQIQQLEKYLHSSSVNEERQRSHFLASTTASRGFQSETPSVGTFKMDSQRFDAQVHFSTEPNSYNNGFPSSVSFSSVDRSFTSGPVEREVYQPKYVDVNYTEGSHDKRWSSGDFPWTKKLEANNKKVFGNHSFRPNQREVINATMSGFDVFVLMPTGGGKSLTYQLPALICEGITLVISPLVSLIQDQIMHLLQANIPAAYLSANLEWTEQQEIFRELSSGCCKYKLLYVTPEKVAK